MKNINKLITTIIIAIDRIDFSIPVAYKTGLLNHLTEQGSFVNSYKKKQYWYRNYVLQNNRITVSGKICDDETESVYDRIYLSVFDPTDATQTCLNKIMLQLTGGISKGTLGILIKQIEVSYDFFCTDDSTINLANIKQFIDHHLVLKYMKPESYSTFKTTNYIGRNGNVRKGSKGSRSYLKDENGKHFYRFEMQYNRPYILKQGLSFHSLPFNPLSFQAFDAVEILDDFSDKGITNFSRSLLRKKGITETTHNNFHALHSKEMATITLQVVGGARGRKRKVSAQLAALKAIKQETGVSVNHKQYFSPLLDVHQLICCHADVGYQEDGCSKRMLLGKTFKEVHIKRKYS